MRIFLSAGEPSGDLHGANLIESLRARLPGAEFIGYGGPRMAEAGAKLLYPLTELAVMWFLSVVANLVTFLRLILRADRYFRLHRPDVVILIDYPGLHWWIARRAKARGIPVVYYVPPQLWAWAGWRVSKVRKTIDLVLCSLPFEPDWYRARGVSQVDYVGHPYFDELNERELNESVLEELRDAESQGPLVAILPGSRTQELKRNLPIMIAAAHKVAKERSKVQFAVACVHDKHKSLAESIVRETLSSLGHPAIHLKIHAGRTPEIIRAASIAWAVSGSVSLELMMEALPTVVLYKVNRFDLMIARPFIKAKYITLVNLLADAELMPEYLTERDVSEELASWARTWLDDPMAHARATANLAALRHVVARPGASQRAAARIVALLDQHSRTKARPRSHYRGPHEPVVHGDVATEREIRRGQE